MFSDSLLITLASTRTNRSSRLLRLKLTANFGSIHQSLNILLDSLLTTLADHQILIEQKDYFLGTKHGQSNL